tara:strand:+ start:42282 stop:42722 length:441 start_codon:yes stop_codon:yes gene_type:complete
MTTDHHIYELASLFRSAIVRTDRSKLPITFAEFPAGSCGDAAILLGTFLTERGCGDFTYISAFRGSNDDDSWHTHAWVAQYDLVVDITADQFPDSDDPVIVVRDSPWHSQFTVDQSHAAHYCVYDANTRHALKRAYDVVMENEYAA